MKAKMASRQEPWTKLAHSKKQPGWVAYNPRTMRPQPMGDDTKHMKILSNNVNGVKNVVRFLTEAKVCPRRATSWTTAQRDAEGAAPTGTDGAAASASNGGGAAA
ncbi:hypothetical protein QYE76_015490 [Lolium multiflorum]|uniref:Uncharacterized protein n=1 Tax=Lolium multiflorum TaxID=4521 RepID=A0AAD8QSC3_LOLMU|nr:hypothetical protein QYE76_030032 [Lolium multiflorum]KAK1698793.1 hypothetical protein QYE76_015490 [Lolium multiflorum]